MKDTSKFRFKKDGKLSEALGKGRLVLEIVKYLANEKYENDLERLRNDFDGDKKVQGTYSIVEPISQIEGSYKEKYTRYFTKPSEMIISKDKQIYAVTSQWGIENIFDFINKAKKMGVVVY